MTSTEILNEADIVRVPVDSDLATYFVIQSPSPEVSGARFRVQQHGTQVVVYFWTYHEWTWVFHDRSRDRFTSHDAVSETGTRSRSGSASDDRLRSSKALVRDALFALFWTP